jgi:prolyl 4-hydroxylase
MINEFEKFVEDEWCDSLIETFDSNDNLHERFDNDGCPNFTQLNITSSGLETEIQQQIVTRINGMVDYYRSIYKFFPKLKGMEEFRIKKYDAGTDRFDWHVDVGDYASARRALAIQIYLNTVEDGGQTKFAIGDSNTRTIEAVKGTAIVFPPMWMFPHCGLPCNSGAKYILTTYMHYV